jgi:hypothetical protein
MARSRYQYSPLDTAVPHIRLLTLLPGPDGEEIRLELDNVPLDDVKFQYDAISYTWGVENPKQEVKITCKYLLLRSNIWHFLKHCRGTMVTKNKLVSIQYVSTRKILLRKRPKCVAWPKYSRLPDACSFGLART